MTTSIEYEKKAQNEIDHIDNVGIRAIELAKIYAKLALAAATREQTEAMRKKGPSSNVTAY
jgi:hypothetical protein